MSKHEMNKYTDIWYSSVDGLRLYARDYIPQGSTSLDARVISPVILCMHGLTRNSADFEDIAGLLTDRYRVISVDQRGRGLSAYDPIVENYNPLVYVQDMFTLIEHLDLSELILMGTSMGGIMAMMITAMKPDLVTALIINDIGAEVGEVGLNRLKKYVGKSAPVINWDDAAKQSAEINRVAFPNANEEDWLRFAKRTYTENQSGIPVLSYDPKIAEPLNDPGNNTAAPNLWPVYDQICDKPMLLIRGELSDILEPPCVETMRQKNQHLIFSQIPDVGHAPLLNEPIAIQAIQDFLSGLEES